MAIKWEESMPQFRAEHAATQTETPEEREAFELMECRQRDPQVCDNRQAKINAMAEIARQCPTTSIEGICALLVDAGYRKE